MQLAAPPNVTGLLKAWSGGNADALDQLIPVVYNELHKIARAYMRRQRPALRLTPPAFPA